MFESAIAAEGGGTDLAIVIEPARQQIGRTRLSQPDQRYKFFRSQIGVWLVVERIERIQAARRLACRCETMKALQISCETFDKTPKLTFQNGVPATASSYPMSIPAWIV